MGNRPSYDYDRQLLIKLADKLARQELPRLSMAEIARRLGVSRTTVASLLRSAQRKSIC